MLFYNCSVFIYPTVAGHKHEINLNVIVIVDSRVCFVQMTTASSGMFGRREVTPTTTVVMHSWTLGHHHHSRSSGVSMETACSGRRHIQLHIPPSQLQVMFHIFTCLHISLNWSLATCRLTMTDHWRFICEEISVHVVSLWEDASSIAFASVCLSVCLSVCPYF